MFFIEAILKESGCTLKDVVRTTMGVKLRGIDVEIDAIALKK